MGSLSPLHIPVPALGVGLLLSAAGHVKDVALLWLKNGKKMTVLRGVPGAQSVFGYKVLGRETDAGRVFTFWGRAREAA